MKSVCLRDFKAVFNKLSGDAIVIILSFCFFYFINEFLYISTPLINAYRQR